MYTVQELRSELKSAGYKIKIVTYSDFKSATILDNTGKKLTSIMTKTDCEYWGPAIAIRDKYKGKVFDGLYRVVL